ncbi:MAG TPA: hypothetical protein VEB00_10050 [Clostridia bacterium]|nr:hypothetical protein [Clostridia bacterium]
MLVEKPRIDITLNNICINSIVSNSGVFAGRNIQYLWRSNRTTQSGFGTVTGENNTLESPFNVVTDPDSSSELIKYLEELLSARIGKRGI